MGGYGSGGHNHRHDYTGRYKQLDSFIWNKYVPLLVEKNIEHVTASVSWDNGNGGSIGVILYQDHIMASYTATHGDERQEIRDDIYFDCVSNNYGGRERIYYECPYCDRRSRYLYLHSYHFKCWICAGLNYASQQITKNEDLTIYKIKKLLRDKFKVTETMVPFDMGCYQPMRPKGMHEETYRKLLLQLYDLQDEYWRQTKLTISRAFKISI